MSEGGERQKRGFALLSPEERRAIAIKGGKASQLKSPHRFTTETAREASRKSAEKRKKES